MRLQCFFVLIVMSQTIAKRIIDQMYPGTAVTRMKASRERAKFKAAKPNWDWEGVRRKILWAAGLKI